VVQTARPRWRSCYGSRDHPQPPLSLMNFDLRLPLGLIFTLYGIILVGTGLLSSPEMIRQTLGQNVTLTWGFVQLLFGLTMLFLSRKRK